MEIKHWFFPFLCLFSCVSLIFFDIDKGESLLNSIDELLQGLKKRNWLELDRLEVNVNSYKNLRVVNDGWSHL